MLEGNLLFSRGNYPCLVGWLVLFSKKSPLRIKLDAKVVKPRQNEFNTTYRKFVGRKILRAFGHPVATCCDMSTKGNQRFLFARGGGKYFAE